MDGQRDEYFKKGIDCCWDNAKIDSMEKASGCSNVAEKTSAGSSYFSKIAFRLL